jgi:hypothetical protein
MTDEARSDTKLSDNKLIWYQNFWVPNLFGTEIIWYQTSFITSFFYGTYLTLNLLETRLIWNQTYMKPNLFDIKLFDMELI